MRSATWATSRVSSRAATGSLNQVGATPRSDCSQLTGNASATKLELPTGKPFKRNSARWPEFSGNLRTSVRLGPATVRRKHDTSVGALVRETSASATSSCGMGVSELQWVRLPAATMGANQPRRALIVGAPLDPESDAAEHRDRVARCRNLSVESSRRFGADDANDFTMTSRIARCVAHRHEDDELVRVARLRDERANSRRTARP